MIKRTGLSLVALLVLLLLFTACTPEQTSVPQNEQPKKVTKEKSADDNVDVQPIALSDYAKEVGLAIKQPRSQVMNVDKTFELSGEIRDWTQLKQSYLWVVMSGPDGQSFDNYIPLKEGKFHQRVALFAGKGEYTVTVRIPDKQQQDRFYDVMTLHVTKESADPSPNIAMRPPGLAAGLTFQKPASGYVKANGSVTLAGTVAAKYNGKHVMIKQQKDGHVSDMLLPIRDGKFSGSVPLHYGTGVHKMTVMVPDLTKDNYYVESAVFSADNTSSAKTEPIKYYRDYYEKQFTLDDPQVGGLQADEKFHISGRYNPEVANNRKVKELVVTTKKGDLEASYLIPANNGTFDGEFWLRFGPGTYEVTLNVPTDPGAAQSYFHFTGLATFTVESRGKDKRNLLPSRGIQSNAPAISELAEKLTAGKKGERAKAKAIYAYVAKTVKYDVKKQENNLFQLDDSALKTLNSKTGVCQDYTFLTVALLRSAGIEARYIGGIGTPPGGVGERHAWVEAKIDGEWLVMDPTWGAGYVQNGKFVPHYDEQYFDPNPTEFKKTHRRDEVIY